MNRITELFKIKYPIIQGGMIWCSGWELASSVSKAGGLGLIGAGSMDPATLRQHIKKCKNATNKPFGVNIPLLYADAEEMFNILMEEGVKIVFTSAGNPAKWTPFLKDHGITVAHVIANIKFALKCQESGVDVIVAEGFEAGGHNGKEETTTMVLVPSVRKVVQLPLIAAGGISSGRAMLAALALGADGVQIGSLFAASVESSAHPNFKQRIVEAKEGDTMLMMKKLVPVRLLRNKISEEIQKLENEGASPEKLLEFVSKGRPRMGMFDGNIDEGELEVGQVSGMIDEIKTAAEIIQEIITEFNIAKEELVKSERFF
jgi:enoyl-[acyl-carrier protein] reductase II